MRLVRPKREQGELASVALGFKLSEIRTTAAAVARAQFCSEGGKTRHGGVAGYFIGLRMISYSKLQGESGFANGVDLSLARSRGEEGGGRCPMGPMHERKEGGEGRMGRALGRGAGERKRGDACGGENWATFCWAVAVANWAPA